MGLFMKEKIDLFARGIFTYQRPGLTVSADSISISAEMGKIYKGSFSVASAEGKPIKGIVYSSDSVLSFENSFFSKADNEIHYLFDATHLDINDTIKGHISVVSELGEREIPFTAQVRVPSCNTSVGPASDLFHFASLAQTDWAEARNLFKSEEFARVLSFYDPKYSSLYKALLKSGNVSLAMEEMLTAARKKRSVNVKSQKSELTFEAPEELLLDTVVILKDTWGYSQLEVDVEGDFISTDKKIIWTDDFVGNSYALPIAIDPSKLHAGTNLGCIRLTSVSGEVRIPVICKNSGQELKSRLSRRKLRHLQMKQVQCETEYILDNISQAKRISEQNATLDSLKVLRPNHLGDRLLRCELLLDSGHAQQAGEIIDEVFDKDEWGDDELLFAKAMYLKCRLDNDIARSDVMDRLKQLYNTTGNAGVYIYCMRLDNKMRMSGQGGFDALRNSAKGNSSPEVLARACRIMNNDPKVIKEFSGFDLRCIYFALRHDILTKNAALQAVYLASKAKTTSRLAINTLILLMRKIKTHDGLETLCKHLVMEGKHNETMFKWLSVGIDEQVQVNNIYEACLSTAGKCPDSPLPKAMLSYFGGGEGLPSGTEEIFFSNVVRFKDNLDGISFELLQKIREFAICELAHGHVNDNLAVLYNKVLNGSDITEAAAGMLPDVVFKHRLEIQVPGITTVIVCHKELRGETAVSVTDGIAYVDIFTEDPVILLADSNGNRILPGKQETSPVVSNPELMRLCMEKCVYDERVALNCLETARYRGDSTETVSLLKRCCEFSDLSEDFLTSCRRELIEYYYDNLEGELMEELLVKMDLALLGRRDRARILELMILRELYSLAINNMEYYGYMGVDVKRLAKLASRLIETSDEKVGTPLFTDICMSVFKRRRHDENILKVLVRDYNGDTESMCQLWSMAMESGIETADLEERLLCQMLFVESERTSARDIFRHYYGRGSNRRLVKAFMSFYSYKYLVHESVPEADMLELMRRESVYEKNDLVSMALLKSMAGQRHYSDSDRMFIEENIEELCRRGIIMPFFTKFGEDVRIPECIQDRYFVEYHTDSRKRVRIHYCMLTGGEEPVYSDEDMRDRGYGIFVSEFTLFYGEVLQYYISEEEGDAFTITESNEICLEPEMIGGEETGYHQLNLIITTREMNDGKTMLKLLESYIRSDYLARHLFRPML